MDDNTPKLTFSPILSPTTTIPPRKWLHRNCSFPKIVIDHFTDNLSSQLIHEKLISTSKYFFSVAPYLRGSIYFNYLDSPLQEDIDIQNCFLPAVENIDQSIKFWIVNKIYIFNQRETQSFSSIAPRIYRCDVTNMVLYNVNLTFDEFLIISPNVDDVDFSNVKIKYSNGELVLLEDIIKNLPKLVACSFSISRMEPNISCNTARKIVQLPHFSNITDFCMTETPEFFDVLYFVNAVKGLQFPRFWINIRVMPSTDYMRQLEECIDELKKSTFNNRVIQYPGENQDNFQTLVDRYESKFIRIMTFE